MRFEWSFARNDAVDPSPLHKKGPHASFDNMIAPGGIGRNDYARPRANSHKICAIVKVINHILMLYATNSNIVGSRSGISWLNRMPNESAVQFADVVCLNAVMFESAYLDERTNEEFIDGLPTAICSGEGLR